MDIGSIPKPAHPAFVAVGFRHLGGIPHLVVEIFFDILDHAVCVESDFNAVGDPGESTLHILEFSVLDIEPSVAAKGIDEGWRTESFQDFGACGDAGVNFGRCFWIQNDATLMQLRLTPGQEDGEEQGVQWNQLGAKSVHGFSRYMLLWT